MGTNVGKLYVHTPKAIRAGAPSTRVYAVVSTEVDEDGVEWLIAWKCKMVDGKLRHPAFSYYQEPLELTDPRLFVPGYKNGAEPTAAFRLDSFYKQLKV
jgi:hypothetical protein